MIEWVARRILDHRRVLRGRIFDQPLIERIARLTQCEIDQAFGRDGLTRPRLRVGVE